MTRSKFITPTPMTPEQKEELKRNVKFYASGPRWVSIEERLPMMDSQDLFIGGTKFRVKFEDNSEGTTTVTDHNTWYYLAKEAGITHWWMD